jgi:hypothetical protein
VQRLVPTRRVTIVEPSLRDPGDVADTADVVDGQSSLGEEAPFVKYPADPRKVSDREIGFMNFVRRGRGPCIADGLALPA